MNEERPGGGREGEDVGADTERFRAFVRGGDQAGEPAGNRFRVLTLAVGLVVLAVIVVLLLR